MPLYDKEGKKLFENDTYYNNKCIFGMMCGGGMGVIIYKENDTLKIRKETSWSD